MECTTCHSDLTDFEKRHEVKEVKFPSGAVIDSGDPNTNLCMNCHQGRESTVSVNKLIGDTADDTTSESLKVRSMLDSSTTLPKPTTAPTAMAHIAWK